MTSLEQLPHHASVTSAIQAQSCTCHPTIVRVHYAGIGQWHNQDMVRVDLNEDEDDAADVTLQRERQTWWKPFGRIQSLHCFFRREQLTQDVSLFVPSTPPRDRSIAEEEDVEDKDKKNEAALEDPEEVPSIPTQWVVVRYGFFGADIPQKHHHAISKLMQAKLKRQTMLFSDCDQALPLYSLLESLESDVAFQQAKEHIEWVYHHPNAESENDGHPLVTRGRLVAFSGNGRRLASDQPSTTSVMKPVASSTTSMDMDVCDGDNEKGVDCAGEREAAKVAAAQDNDDDDGADQEQQEEDVDANDDDPEYRPPSPLPRQICRNVSRDGHCALGTECRLSHNTQQMQAPGHAVGNNGAICPRQRYKRSRSPTLLELIQAPDSSTKTHHRDSPNEEKEDEHDSGHHDNPNPKRSRRCSARGYSKEDGFVVSDGDGEDEEDEEAVARETEESAEKNDDDDDEIEQDVDVSGATNVAFVSNPLGRTSRPPTMEPLDPFANDSAAAAAAHVGDLPTARPEYDTETRLQRFQQFIAADDEFMYQTSFWHRDLFPVLVTLVDCNNNLLDVWPLLWKTRFNLPSLRASPGSRNWGDRGVCFFCKKAQPLTYQVKDPWTGMTHPAGSVCATAILAAMRLMHAVRQIRNRVRSEYSIRQHKLHNVSASSRIELSLRYERPLVQEHEWKIYQTQMQEAIQHARALRATG